jgi:hypothetical protein
MIGVILGKLGFEGRMVGLLLPKKLFVKGLTLAFGRSKRRRRPL